MRSPIYLSMFLVSTLGFGCGGGGAATSDAGPGIDSAPSDSDAPTSTAAPLGGVFRSLPEVTVTASEAGTIYYTVDGSEPTTSSASGASPITIAGLTEDTPLRFFAVDEAGNQEAALREELYSLERFGPDTLQNFTALVDTDDVTLSWENPSFEGFTEVVIAAVPDVTATAVPGNGTVLAQGDTLATGGSIVYVGNAESTLLTDVPAGNYSYVGWARYDSGVFSDARTAAASVAVAAAPGQITIDVAAQTVTVNTQPAGYTLAGAAVVFDAGTLTFDLTATSTLPGMHFNTKLAVVSATGGALNNADGTMADGGSLDGNAFRYFGPEGVLEQQAVTRSLEFTGVAVNGTLVLEVGMQSDRALFMPSWEEATQPNGLGAFDIANDFSIYAGARPPTFDNPTRENDLGAFRGGALTADGRYIFFGARNMPRVSKLDLSTMDIVAGVDITLTQEAGAVTDLWMGAEHKRLWAVVNDGMHSATNQSDSATYAGRIKRTLPPSNSVYLVEIDAVTLTEVARVPLGSSADLGYRGRRMSLSADGRWAAIAAGAQYVTPSISEIFLVDLMRREVVDADDATAGVQSFDVQGLRPSQTAFTRDGSYVVFNNSWNDACDNIGVIAIATKTVTIYDYDDTTDCDEKAINFIPLNDNRVQVVGSFRGLVSFNPADGSFVSVGATSYYHNWAVLSEDGSRYLGSVYGSMEVITTADGVVEKSVSRPGSSLYGHHPLVTPF